MSARRPLVKICGVRTPEQALGAAAAGANFVGLVFYPPSPRYVTETEATAVTRALRDAGVRTAAVGLFVNESAARINALAACLDLAVVQLSGDEPAELVAQIDLPVLRTIRVTTPVDQAGLRARLAHELTRRGGPPGPFGQPVTFLLDAHVPGYYGGTGARADWTLAATLARDYPLVLAGGLTPAEVGDAVRTVRPLGVDVSSGVETGGVKDLDKITRFIQAARAAADVSQDYPLATVTAPPRAGAQLRDVREQ